MAVTNVALAETAPPPIVVFHREALGGGDQSLAYDGHLGELTLLWLKTLVLSFLTLGFYRFWGRTRIRKYLWSRVSLDGDRFEYDGTGGELFRRFLVAVVVLTPLFFLPLALQLFGASLTAVDITKSLQGLLIAFLALVGYYAGRRYRLSRTVWRGIRGGLGGSAALYAAKTVLAIVLTVVTIGIYMPWQRVTLWRYEANHMRAGDASFGFEGRGRDLVGAWLTAFVALVLTVAAIGGLVAAAGLFDPQQREALRQSTTLPVLIVLIVAIIMLAPIVWGLLLVRFNAKWLSYMASRTRLEGVRFDARIGTWRLVQLQLGNLVVLAITAGLGWPFVGHRMLKFWCAQLAVSGVESLEHLTQETPPPKAGAEGLAQMLGESGFA
jgi:uncharacterized membrane protein YjgN (DUF898 family)